MSYQFAERWAAADYWPTSGRRKPGLRMPALYSEQSKKNYGDRYIDNRHHKQSLVH